MKYIDADKLLTEIERRKADAKLYDMSGGDAPIYDELLSIITSLQQEQSFPRWIHANYSDKPEIRHTPSGTPYLQNGSYMIWLSDLETLPKDGTELTNHVREQPEVELEKEILDWIGDEGSCKNGKWTWYECNKMLRHFYELGFNARK